MQEELQGSIFVLKIGAYCVVEDDDRERRPLTSTTLNNVNCVKEIIVVHRQIIADDINLKCKFHMKPDNYMKSKYRCYIQMIHHA